MNRIDGKWVIRVSDFGLSECLNYSKDYIRQFMNNETRLPFKWMAPESLCDGLFSEKSDVVHI